MDNFNISIFGNQIFLKILNELKLFNNYKFKFFSSFDLFINESLEADHLKIFFINNSNHIYYKKIVEKNYPTLIVGASEQLKNLQSGNFIEKISIPFNIFDFEKKIVSLLSKYKFNVTSLIKLNSYIINKNERKIKKSAIELILTEKEINFLILFSKSKNPISRDFILKNLWQYSLESETHTVETHIHRLRKKIFDKFGDKNFIKNNKKGYYI